MLSNDSNYLFEVLPESITIMHKNILFDLSLISKFWFNYI